MSKNEDLIAALKCIEPAYKRGFKFGYLIARVGIEWPTISPEELKPYEIEVEDALKRWEEAIEKKLPPNGTIKT